jgi:hypothetical protein
MIMRKPYPIPTHRLPPQAAPAMPNLPPGRRVSLLAMQEEIQIPAQRGFAGARRLKILRIEQASLPPDALAPPPPLREPMRAPFTHTAPPRRTPLPPHLELRTELPAEPPEFECWLEGKHVRLRGVAEMMADEAGNYYEVRGEQLRPLGELVSDERGRIFEIQPASEIHSTAAAKERVGENSSDQGQLASTATDDGHYDETPSPPTRAQAVQAADSPGYRKLIADPGLYLKLPWARVKSELAPQLKHPEKLRDDVLIECHAQIYEAQRTLPAAELGVLELGDDSLASQLHPLTQAKAQVLGAPQLFKSTREPFETRAANRQIYAGQRVYRIWPLFDPTVERAKPSEPIAKPEESATTPRHQIPPQYMNPLQFKYSREEVLYDMRGVLGTLPIESGALMRWLFVYPLRLLKTLITMMCGRRGLKKWRAMLEGKCVDEQLWAVTPPRGFSYHPTVRCWAEEMLIQTGHDSRYMFLEWEIFWRRKGWN